MPGQDQRVQLVDVHFGIAIARCQTDWTADARDHAPGLRGVLQIWPAKGFRLALEESHGIQSERLADLLQQCWQRPRPAQHTSRQREQRCRLGAGLRRLPGSTGCYVDDGTDRDRHKEEREQRDKVLPLSDGKHPHRRGEEVVQKEEPTDGGQQCWEQTAYERDSHHYQEKRQYVSGQGDVPVDRE